MTQKDNIIQNYITQNKLLCLQHNNWKDSSHKTFPHSQQTAPTISEWYQYVTSQCTFPLIISISINCYDQKAGCHKV